MGKAIGLYGQQVVLWRRQTCFPIYLSIYLSNPEVFREALFYYLTGSILVPCNFPNKELWGLKNQAKRKKLHLEEENFFFKYFQRYRRVARIKGLPRWLTGNWVTQWWLSQESVLPDSTCRRGDKGSIPSQKDSLREEMVIHSSTLAGIIPWTEEPSGLQSIGTQRVGHDWVTEHMLE